MADDIRKQTIQDALNAGYSADEIDKVFREGGAPALSTYEKSLIRHNRFGQNLAERAASNLQDYNRGLGTLGGTIGLALFGGDRGKEIRSIAGEMIGSYAKDILTGKRNLATDLTNMQLSPYNTTVQDIARNPLQAGANILAGIATNPVDAFLETLTALPVGVGASVAAKITDKVPVVNQMRRGIGLTPEEQRWNRALNAQDIAIAPEITRSDRAMAEIRREGNLEDAIRNLQTGNWTDDAYTTRVRDFARDYNRQMVELGLDPNDAKRVATNQYILENVDPDRARKISAQAIDNAVKNPTEKAAKSIGLNTKEELDTLISQGNDLFDRGLIFPITQRGLNQGSGVAIDATGKVRGLQSQRLVGNASIKDIADNFYEGYRNLRSEIISARQAQEGVSELAKDFGRKVSPEDVGKIRKDEVVISPTQFNQGVRTLFAEGKQSDLPDLVKTIGKGAGQDTLVNYADDLFVVKKKDLNALQRRVQRQANTTSLSDDLPIPTGLRSAINNLTRGLLPLTTTWQSSVLARPQYFIGNRIGNYILNALGGADYARVARDLVKGNLLSETPAYLRTSTSYHGLNPNIFDLSLKDLARENVSEIGKAARNLVSKDRTLGERLGDLGTIADRGQRLFTDPIFQAESTLEYLDRAAAYFNRVNQEARRTGRSAEDIIASARENPKLQAELLEGVNRQLGDYVGGNYYLDQTARNLGRLAVPFRRVITTAPQIIRHQLRENPLRFQNIIRNPARVGRAIDIYTTEALNQPRDNDSRGGLTIVPTFSKRFPSQVLYNDYNPMLAFSQLAQNVLGIPNNQYSQGGIQGLLQTFAGNLSPATGIVNAIQGLDRYGNPAAGPNSYTVNGKVITLDNNGNPTIQKPDVVGGILGYIGSNLLPIATLANNWILPSLAVSTGREYYRPTNRTIFGQIGDAQSALPYLYEGRTDEAPLNRYADYILNLGGWRTRNVYFPRQGGEQPTGRDVRTILRRSAREGRLRDYRRGE